MNNKWIYTIIGIIAFIILLTTSIVIVPAGYNGVHLRFGKVVGIFPEGMSMKMPFIDGVEKMSIQTQLYEEPSTMAASKDLQDVKTSIAINYKLDPVYVGEVYRTVGINYIKRIGAPAVQEVVKQVAARYNAEEMITRRAQVKDDITDALTKRLRERGIITEIVNITNFEFSATFTQAIEAKVAANQAVLEAEQRLRKIEVEARQAEQKAIGEANAAIARAEGQATAAGILSKAIENNPAYLQYLYIDKLAAEADVIVVPEGLPLTLPTRR